MDALIGIDVGGTSVKGGLVVNGKLAKKASVPVNQTDSVEAILYKISEILITLGINGAKGIGIGVPGLVDDVTGVVFDIFNIPALKKVNLKTELEKSTGLPVFINNDANCFALGEKYFGKGKPFRHFAGVTLGTGLGVGLVANHHLYSGKLCGAGEIGTLPYKNGIMEDYTASFFFKNHYNTTGEALFEAASKADPVALEAFETFGNHLGEAMLLVLYAYAPEAIIFGGSISKAFPFFEKSLRNTLNKFAFKRQLETLQLLVSNTNDSGILGAAALCLD